ncbi:Gfo/Idh/MocA family protein [Croceivirga sp. JEA036]|uniref:Gfo/Idh/MocA family protein n=1 Tax=Croceivirga sp. JEA036 TaxID=2721162 RepID=UPI00143A4D51|nr:Gfo/Idh/MocA family oxidoreductase [Croceivirga sp. JEA036]NJB35222.1 Gfo/Idh/MocA family oxidoreductase [Croceivirga sp. JEA036]
MKTDKQNAKLKKKSETDKKTPVTTRRGFILKTGLAVGALTIVPRHVLGKGFIAPSDKINIGFIGLGKQSRGLAKGMITNHAEIIACSDVWTTKNDWFKNHVASSYQEIRNSTKNNSVKSYLNYKEMLMDTAIDAVVIASPDHWHAKHVLDSVKADKDVYCEKPLSHNIAEGRAMVKAVERSDKVLQVGSMQRSWDTFRKACELVRNGYLGDITRVEVNVGDPAKAYDLAHEAMPAAVNWNNWCGPAPLLAYNHRLAPSSNDVKFWPDWRLFEETGGGILSDWGAHMFDIVQWALGMDHSGPVKIVPPKDKNAVRGLKMYYANGIEVEHKDFGRGWGVRFFGSKGQMDISRNYFETTPENLVSTNLSSTDTRLYKSDNHAADWLNAIKKRSKPVCDVEIGHRSATICHLANIGYKLNRELEWNPEKEKFKGDAAANKLRSRKERKF